jgi:hypothetical protein
MGTGSLFAGVKQLGRGVDHQPAMPLPEHFRLLRHSFAVRREDITIKSGSRINLFWHHIKQHKVEMHFIVYQCFAVKLKTIRVAFL